MWPLLHVWWKERLWKAKVEGRIGEKKTSLWTFRFFLCKVWMNAAAHFRDMTKRTEKLPYEHRILIPSVTSHIHSHTWPACRCVGVVNSFAASELQHALPSLLLPLFFCHVGQEVQDPERCGTTLLTRLYLPQFLHPFGVIAEAEHGCSCEVLNTFVAW